MKFLISFFSLILPFQYYLCSAEDLNHTEMSEVTIPKTMNSWKLSNYNNSIYFDPNTTIPEIKHDNEVLVKVIASSVNVLDLYMSGGYGKVFFNFYKKILHFTSGISSDEFPVILGRDFVGQIVAAGKKAAKEYTIGTVVMGVTLPPRDGCHAEYVIAKKDNIIEKPSNVSSRNAAAILFAGMTAWSALNYAGDFWIRKRKNKKVLVIGASGGVGTVAVQLLNAWEAKVIATACGSSGLATVSLLNPEKILDYTKNDTFFDDVKKNGPYDVILDAAGIPESQYKTYAKNLKPWSFSKFISLKPPFLPNTDRYGMLFGIFKTIYDMFAVNFKCGSILETSFISYGIMVPSRKGLLELASMLENNQLQAVIDSVFPFTQAPRAYDRVKRGSLRGKVVLTY